MTSAFETDGVKTGMLGKVGPTVKMGFTKDLLEGFGEGMPTPELASSTQGPSVAVGSMEGSSRTAARSVSAVRSSGTAPILPSCVRHLYSGVSASNDGDLKSWEKIQSS